MAEGAGGNTGPFDITILTLLENQSEIQINVSERTGATVSPTLASPSVGCVAVRVTWPALPGRERMKPPPPPPRAASDYRPRKRRPWNVRPTA
jgi:hypothetical protein